MRQHTRVPVPEVYAWCSNPSNPVGVEYIIMEKAAGVPLYSVWGEAPEYEKLDLIQALTILENQLCSLQFPAYGSLYLRTACRNIEKCTPLDQDSDTSESYCVGRSGDRSYVPEFYEEKDASNIDLGPCKYTQTVYRISFLIIFNCLQGAH